LSESSLTFVTPAGEFSQAGRGVRGEGDGPGVAGHVESSLALQPVRACRACRGHGQDGLGVLARAEEVGGARVLVALLVAGVERSARGGNDAAERAQFGLTWAGQGPA
jgi:hypothetical protein